VPIVARFCREIQALRAYRIGRVLTIEFLADYWFSFEAAVRWPVFWISRSLQV
jgi:hypothetical protein